MVYYIIYKARPDLGRAITVKETADEAATFMLGRSMNSYWIVKSEDKLLTDFTSNDVLELAKQLEAL